MGLTLPVADNPARFWSKVDLSQPDECWLWTARIDKQGYGRIHDGARGQRYAHQVVWELVAGPIPEGLEIDHVCRVRSCVNPSHLDAVTHAENLRRSPLTPAAITAARGTCAHGHPYDAWNTGITTKGTKWCRACNRERKRLAYARKVGKA
jgi:hypothetical protein